MKNLIYILLLIPQLALAQISGVINTYVKVTDVDHTCNKVTVSPNPTGFSVGDTVLLIQMQGALMDQSNTTSFGNITSINNTGNYEFGEIAAISSNDIYFKNTILKTYTPDDPGKVQLVSVPQYSDVTINGTLSAEAWNGDTGGILVFEASGTVTMEADMDVSGLGFRGGEASVSNNSYGCTNTTSAISISNQFYYTYPSPQGGRKGEGIAGWVAARDAGKGRNANGAGGGNGHNSGGGGGSNYGSGGKGGDKISSCGGIYPNGPGEGGLSLNVYYSNATNKIFMGGGGGGGQQNNWTSPGPPTFVGGTPGGPGGGIIIVKANAIDGNGYSILSNGTLNSAVYRSWGDGGGGGGAGGTVLLSTETYLSALTVSVNGGNGNDVYDETGRNPGPGGGGGGGFLWVSTGSMDGNISLNANGGSSGTVSGPGSCGCNHNAQAGSPGSSLTNLSMPRSTTIFNQTCISLPVQLINYFAKYNSNKVTICWTSCNEKDNKEYIVEKTKDLHHFEPVAIIPSKGNSITNLNYTAWDYNPYPEDAYYRLSQKDIDGTVQVLKVAYVSTVSSGNLIKKVYPQPFGSELSIELNENAILDKAVITIFNTIGQEVFTIETNASELHLPLHHLPRGIYFLTVASGGHKETVKIIKAE